MTTAASNSNWGTSSTQPLPQSQAQRLSRSSYKASRPPSGSPAGPREESESEDQDQDMTPRAQHQIIGHNPDSTSRPRHQAVVPKSSTDTLRLKNTGDSSTTSTPLTAASQTLSNTSSTTAVSNGKQETKDSSTVDAPPSSQKFGLGNKKKRQQRQEQEREERRLKEEANEALRKKHGEYHPPGHSQGQIHTHRLPPNHDHHQLEQSRSSGNIKFQYQQQHQRSQSSIRIDSSRPMSPTSSRSHVSPSPSPSSCASTHSRQSSYSRSRPTSPIRDMIALSIDYASNPHMDDLRNLDAEGILSEHWDSESEEEDRALEKGPDRDMDTDSSYRTNNSSVVRFDLGDQSETSRASSRRPRRNRHSNRSTTTINTRDRAGGSHQIDSEPQHSADQNHVYVEMEEVGNPNHQSWPLKNMSTTGIVTGLEPEIDGQSVIRPHSSMSRHTTKSKSRDPLVERYLYHARPTSPTRSIAPSSASNHRPHSRHRHYQYQQSHNQESDHETFSDLTPSALDAMRSKAGSRAGGTIRGTTLGGSGDTSSLHGTEVSQPDEHNYLAPLPPFQQGPAYSKVPKRKFCKWFCGGCRWWVLLLLILIPAGLIAVATAFLLHFFQVCVPIDPNTVDPIVYTIDPSAISNIALEYQTRTKGIINIVDSPNANETFVLMKLQRQFYKMKNRQDLTGFQIDTLSNGTARFVLNDAADSHREFFISTVLCSNSILTIEMPRAAPGRPEVSLYALVDQQDVYINMDETVPRNSTWQFKGISNHNLLVQSLNINSLSISYTSSSPSALTLASVIIRDKLSVVSVSGDIQASVGFSSSANSSSTTASLVNLNTLDGQIQLDMKAWNQTSTFQISSPDIQVSKSGEVVLPFGKSNGTTVNVSGLTAIAGLNSVSGSYSPGQSVDANWTQPTSTRGTGTVSGTATATATAIPTGTSTQTYTTYTTVSGTGTATGTATGTGTRTGTATATGTATTSAPSATVSPPGPSLGAGGSSIPAQFIIQANGNVTVNFP
ncbi:hypothetical protein EDD21DRAFT_382206 [Dissophora ornata]|nr:hypothetical protein BGZ58_008326 [Dissophora ornata]KAI8598537.1 hypothetical protein EDD21DRAFT_382206 [Dissophora ornata]